MQFITCNQIQDDINGRLGNQLFRIAAAIGYSKKHGIEVKFPLWKNSKYFEGEKLFNTFVTPTNHYYREPFFHYVEIPKTFNSLDLIGYFQSQKYFENAIEEVKNVLSIKKTFINSLEKNKQILKNSCSIHFRHGDVYDRNNGQGHKGNEHHHPVMSKEYYRNSIEYMLSQGVENFYIFYDHETTKDWIEEENILSDIKYTYLTNLNSHIEDFVLMSLCDNNIIANSTYSWWAAWLNNNINKKIIAPNIWFGEAYSHYDLSDLIPSEWRKI